MHGNVEYQSQAEMVDEGYILWMDVWSVEAAGGMKGLPMHPMK